MEELALYGQSAAVQLRRDMLTDESIMGGFDETERSIFKASTGKPFSEYEGAELAAELAGVIKFIAKDVGYREASEGELGFILLRLCGILKRHYATLTVQDFCVAFELLVVGELDAYLPKRPDGQADRGHYQQFNAEYVCKVLNAYKARRSPVLWAAYDKLPAKVEAPTEDELRVYADATKRDCVEAYESYRATGVLPQMSPIAEMLFYKQLSDAGLAGEIEVTEDEQREILQRTLVYLIGKGQMGEAAELKAAGVQAEEIQFGAFRCARRKALEEAFERMAADGVVLTDYIKFE